MYLVWIVTFAEVEVMLWLCDHVGLSVVHSVC